MLAEAAQATKILHLHFILKGFSLLFVTALLHPGLTLGSLPCAPGLGGLLIDPDVFLLLPQLWDSLP